MAQPRLFPWVVQSQRSRRRVWAVYEARLKISELDDAERKGDLTIDGHIVLKSAISAVNVSEPMESRYDISLERLSGPACVLTFLFLFLFDRC